MFSLNLVQTAAFEDIEKIRNPTHNNMCECQIAPMTGK